MNPKIKDWSGKRVWLVGASAGIGAALAHALAAQGARLALSSRKLSSLQALNIDGALLLPCDSTQPESLTTARDALLQAMGGVDLAVSCERSDWRLISPELDIEDPDNWEVFTLKPGVHHMDADLALWYARSRLLDPLSDWGRSRRQQQLLWPRHREHRRRPRQCPSPV